MTATVLAVLALAGGTCFVLIARREPSLPGRDTRRRRLAARLLQGVYLVSGMLLLVRGTISLLTM